MRDDPPAQRLCRCSGKPEDCPDSQWVMEPDGADWDATTRTWRHRVLYRCTVCRAVVRPAD
jgi:hypothetical protein